MGNNVTVHSGIGFLGACFILFVNFGDNNYDLYDCNRTFPDEVRNLNVYYNYN